MSGAAFLMLFSGLTAILGVIAGIFLLVPMGIFAFLNLYESPLNLFPLFIAIEIIYLYLIAGFLEKYLEEKEKTRKGMLIFFIIYVAVSIASVYIRGQDFQNQMNRIKYPTLQDCKTYLMSASTCVNSTNGNWNPIGCGKNGCLASDYGVISYCLSDGNPFDGTNWKIDETHFSCGTRPY
ncbi:MAG TPA: hypothetical protein VJI13_01495 [Candidatus Norongarragalinales archaeon]|nr:hypothetical protein [Candidatus Norongarragalinales archaeon]